MTDWGHRCCGGGGGDKRSFWNCTMKENKSANSGIKNLIDNLFKGPKAQPVFVMSVY